MKNQELSIMTVKGVNYDIADATSRRAIAGLSKNIENMNSTIETHKQGILELAQQLTAVKDNETVRRTCLSVEDVSSFPILKFNKDFSIMLDISIIVNDELYSVQQIIKYYKGKLYRKVIDSNYLIDCYYQIMNDTLYLFFDTYCEHYDLSLNVISYDGDVPKMVIDENKFSTNTYANAIKLR